MEAVPSTRRSRPRVGLVIAGGTYAYQTNITFGAHEECARQGFDFVCLSGGSLNWDDPRSHAYSLEGSEGLDAVILVPGTWGAPFESTQVRQLMDRFSASLRCVIGVRSDTLPCLWVDNEAGVHGITRHLIEAHGRRRVAFIAGSGAEAPERQAGYERALRDANIAPDKALIFEGDYQPQSGHLAVDALTRDGALRCDAIVAANDWMAVGALEALSKRGISVPDAVSLVGFDDIERAAFITPALSTVRQPPHTLGSQAVLLLAGLLKDPTACPRLAVPTALMLRRSCGCYGNVAAVTATSSVTPAAPTDGLCWTDRAALQARQIADRLPRSLPDDWAEQLVEALTTDLSDPSSQQFVAVVQQLIAHSRQEGNIGLWYHVIGRIRDECGHALAHDAKRLARAESLLAGAFITVGDQAERAQGQRLIDREDVTRRLDDVATDARRALDLPGLCKVLETHLPRLEIPGYYVVAEPHVAGTNERRLLLSYTDGARDELPEGGLACAAGNVLPDGHAPPRRHSHVVYPLFMGETILGHCCAELGPLEGAIFPSLADILSGTFESIRLSRALVKEATQRERAERARMSQELEIAQRIQTAVLPSRPQVEGLDIATCMLPASEVGGDYYDVLPHTGGAWLGIGDVTGHGLTAGLTMLMIQSMVAATVHCRPTLEPHEAWHTLNTVLSRNIRQRMRTNDHATLSLIRYESSGKLSFAGAHEDFIVYRAESGTCERVEPPGIWAGISEHVEPCAKISHTCTLNPGDLLLLYTDGVLEATRADGTLFETDRLVSLLTANAHQPVEAICTTIVREVKAWMARQDDDLTLVVARQL